MALVAGPKGTAGNACASCSRGVALVRCGMAARGGSIVGSRTIYAGARL